MSDKHVWTRCAVAVAAFIMLVTGSVTASALPPPGRTAGTSVSGDVEGGAPGTDGLPCPHGVRYTPYPSDQGNPPDITHWYTRCTGNYVEVSYDNPTEVISGCMSGAEMYLGPKYPFPSFLYWTRQSFRDTNIIRDCQPGDPVMPQLPFPDPVQYPWVQVEGTVQVTNPNGLGEASQALAGAEYGLFYLSQADDSTEWLPVRDGICGDGQEVTGHLDEAGRFRLEFVYPQDYECDGSTWIGCPAVTPLIPWLHSHACADDAIVLRVYATNDDGSVRVQDNTGTTRMIDDIPVGRFFDRVVNHVYTVDNPVAHTYLGVHNYRTTARPVTDHQPTPTTVRLLPGNAPTRYLPDQGIAELGEDNAAGTDPEFVAGIAQFHDLTGPDLPSIPADCTPDVFAIASSDLCALVTGYAAALANQAEEPHTTSNGIIRIAGTTIDIERCGTEEGPGNLLPCADGPRVAGRVAAFFRDLIDSGDDNEQLDGFTDTVSHPVFDVPGVVGDAKPGTIDEFWSAWRAVHPSTTRLAMFWNTLGYTDIQDENDAVSVANAWTTQSCLTCRGGDLALAVPNGAATHREWDFNRFLTHDDIYDIWVRLPEGLPEYTDAARFVVHTHDGVRTFTVNQREADDGWINLSETGVGRLRPEDDTHMFLNTDFTSTSTLVADAVILAPQEGDVPVAPAPPVRVEGAVDVPASIGNSRSRPLDGARYELLYRDVEGQLRPVLSGTGPNGEPAGPAVKGYLGGEGDYELVFRYPNEIPLSDGTRWTGCARPAQPVDFQGSYACADEDLILRVYSVNADESVRVEHDGVANEIAIAHDVPLGLFFNREPHEMTSYAESPAAYAYGASYNVRELAGNYLGPVLIELFEGDASAPSSYRSFTDTINLNTLHAGSSTPEHEAGHGLEDDLTGFDQDLPCDGHQFDRPSTDTCAWAEGFAYFISAAAERQYVDDPNYPPRIDGNYNVESCEADACVNRGPDVEGSIAMLLYDLWDHSPEEVVDGFGDRSTYSIAAILDVVKDAEPDTFAEFWAAWRAKYGDVDNETVFLNALGYVHFSDAGDDRTDAQGAWENRACTSGCTGGSLLLSAGAASMAWQVGPSIKDAGRYDIWVRIPPSSGASETSARYRVDTASGPLSVFVDQSTASGWVNLRAEGFDLAVDETVRVTLTHSTADHEAPIVADALMVVPRPEQQ